MRCGIINSIKGVRTLKNFTLKSESPTPYSFNLRRMGIGFAEAFSVPSVFPLRKEIIMAKNKLSPTYPIKKRPLPIVVVPDKSYIGDTGDIIPTDVILIADPIMYQRMSSILVVWGKEQMGVPGKRGEIDG